MRVEVFSNLPIVVFLKGDHCDRPFFLASIVFFGLMTLYNNKERRVVNQLSMVDSIRTIFERKNELIYIPNLAQIIKEPIH